MKDNMKNLREASEVVLKNIYVTNELKTKTLEKCTRKKVLIVKPRLTATFSAALIVFFGMFIYFFNKPTIDDGHIAKSINKGYENSLANENKIQETDRLPDSSSSDKSSSAVSGIKNNIKGNVSAPRKNIDIAMRDSNNISEDKNISTVNENRVTDLEKGNDSREAFNSVLESKADTSNRELNPEGEIQPKLALSEKPLTIEKAEEYFESKVLLPSYIPEGFELTDISIIYDKEKSIKLEYSSDSVSFEIVQSKNLSKLVGTKNIYIGNNIAYVNSVKDEKTNIATTEITWIMNNIQYFLSSRLSEDSLVKIAESINK